MDVALSMTNYLFSKEEYEEKNLIFSPLSIQAALAVMDAGSDGRTSFSPSSDLTPLITSPL
ncbi:serpin-ZX-like protein [Trifolium pratense]|uniref:Serpin-ZX-like protein n=1 Tax=Trifolium pratense TaxID=57577 RepID=A0A2K3PBL1_TRIPR|nr:serpin-ZX-like protein [Trifolium pratense]